MSVVTVNGVTVIGGTINRPLVGVWVADLVVDELTSSLTPGTAATIQSSNGYSLSGTVDPNRTGSFLDATHVRVLGGAGGLGSGKKSTAKSLVQPGAFVKDVLGSITGDSGETLSSTIGATFLTQNLSAWSVMGGQTCAWNLKTLLKWQGATYNWRILADGTLWIGAETWPTASGTFDGIVNLPDKGYWELGVEAPFVVPGTSISGVGNINRVVDVVEGGRLRSHVYVDLASEGERGPRAAIQRMVQQQIAGVDYFAPYVCQIVSQSADLATVDVQFQGASKGKIAGLSRIPVRAGTGIKIQFSPGSTAVLMWDGGNPSNPYVSLGSSSETPIKIQLAGTHPAPYWDTFFTDFVAYIVVLDTLLKTLVPVTGATGTAAYATATGLPTSFINKMLVAANYQSQIVSNG